MKTIFNNWKSKFGAAILALTLWQPAQGAELAPYFYYWGVGKVNRLTDARRIMGLSNATFAFIVAGQGCSMGADLSDALPDIRSYISSGGRLILSFGGAAGTYVEVACTDDNQLFNLMDRVIIDTGTRRFDFDVEGHQLSNTTSHQRRARVLKRLQDKYPDLYVSFTLPGWFNGLNSDSLNVINIARGAGVRINIINVMTMSWGAENVRTMIQPATLGRATVVTIDAVAKQLQGIYSGSSLSQMYGMIGITPMIGTNDDATTFTHDDAATVTQYAINNGIGHLAYWAFQRDQAQSYPGATALNSFSGVVQSDFQYYYAFGRAVGASVTPAPAPAPEPIRAPATISGCSFPDWVTGRQYAAGTIVRYGANGLLYRAKYANPGYNPTVSTYYWERHSCTETTAAPAPAPATSCTFPDWVTGRQYAAGTIVRYGANGLLYRAKYANPGYNPTVSTYYWEVYSCSAPAPAPAPAPSCTFPDWVTGRQYAAGTIVRYAPNGKLYRAKYANPGYTPTISTYYWAEHYCQ